MPEPDPSPVQRPLRAAVFGLVAGGMRWRRYEVADRSMSPTLEDGDWVIALPRPRRIRVGDIVITDLPGSPGFELVKRVSAVDPTDASLWLVGDNPDGGSVDSGTFGSVPPASITARVVMRYRPLPVRLLR